MLKQIKSSFYGPNIEDEILNVNENAKQAADIVGIFEEMLKPDDKSIQSQAEYQNNIVSVLELVQEKVLKKYT